MNAHRRIALGLLVSAASLVATACGGSHHHHVSSSSPSAAAGGSAAVAQAPGSGAAAPSSAASQNAAGGSTAQPAKRHKPSVRLTPKQQRRFYQEGANPKVATAGKGTKGDHSRRRGRVDNPTSHGAGLGSYIGPSDKGASRCGYVAVGAGMEQAESFLVDSVPCDKARKLAVASNGHTTIGKLKYNAMGFSCIGSSPRPKALVKYQCTQGQQSVSFLLS